VWHELRAVQGIAQLPLIFCNLAIRIYQIGKYKTRKLCYRKDDRAMRAIYVDLELLQRYGHSKLSKMAAAAILNLFESKIAPLDPPYPNTPPYNQT